MSFSRLSPTTVTSSGDMPNAEIPNWKICGSGLRIPTLADSMTCWKQPSKPNSWSTTERLP